MRIFQLAKELNVDSREILDALDDMGVSVRSNLASVDEKLEAELRELFKPKPTTARVSKEEAVRRALREREARERAALEAARREEERKEAARKAARDRAAARRAQQRQEERRRAGESLPPAPEPAPAPAARAPQEAPPPAPAQPASPQPPAEAVASAEPAAAKPAPPAARRAAPPTGGSRLGKAVIAPPPTTAKERAKLLGRPLAAGRPTARPTARPTGRRPAAAPPRPAPPADRPKSGRAARRADRRRREQTQAEGRQVMPGAAGAAPAAEIGTVRFSEGITVKDLAERMGLKAKDVIKRLFLEKRMMPTINHALDEETARWVIEAFGGTPELVGLEEEAVAGAAEQEVADRPEDLVPRPPVVTMMGHVDHGKTSLLDAIRKSRVAEREAGGITQHIGAYKVEHEFEGQRREIVFLDTPGHEAFTLMRARGAQVTDIVVLVVAADDGVMPQTIEAINHAQAAGVPLVVAVNKIDKPGANPDRVLQQLADHGVLVEQFGGKAIAVPVSAKTGEGLSDLLEMIQLVADVEELRANPDRPATGTVLEAKLDKARGPIATILVQNGTLRVGDVFVVGATMGRVRALADEYDKRLTEAGPATPVVVMGLEDVPAAGDTLQVFPDEQKARQLALYRQQKQREEEQARRAQLPTLDNLFTRIQGGEVTELPIVLKADVQGSVEVLERSLTDLSTDEVTVNVIHSGTGAITETDILLASASHALVIGFNVRPQRGVTEIAAREGVDIRLHTVIYNVAEEIKQAMLAKLSPVAKEVYLGRAEVRQVFRVPKVGVVAGCYVVDGVVRRDASARLLRDNVVVYEGKVASLRRFKDDAKEVRAGFECGIGLERFQDIKPGDEIEAFVVEMKQRESLEETHTT